MNDNLRDRVTRVLNRELLAQLPDALSSGDDLAPSPSGTINLQHLADAVISELGLRQEWLTEQSSRLGIVALTEPDHPIATRTSSPWIAQPPGPRPLWDIFAEADTETE